MHILTSVSYFSTFTPHFHARATVLLFSYLLICSFPSSSLPQHKVRLQLRMEGMRLGVPEPDFS